MLAFTRIHTILASIAVSTITLVGLLYIHWPFLRDPDSLKFFGTVDAWVYTGAGQFFVDDRLSAGEFPLWNPLIFCGQPIAGNPQYLLYYPPNLLRSALTFHPTPWNTAVGLAILAFAHGILAALGGFAFARFRGLSRIAGAFAGVVFALSSAYLQRFFLHHHIVFVVAWLPWNLLAIDWAGRSASSREAFGRYSLAGVVFAMTILAGSPQLAYFVALTMVLYWSLRRVEGLIIGRGGIGASLREIAGGALAVVVSVALSAALIFPAIEFSRNTQRLDATSERIETEPSRESASVREALTFYPGGESHEGVKGIGAAASILAMLGLLSSRRREAIVFGALAVLLIASSTVDSPIMHRVIGPLAPFPISSPGRLTLMAALPLAMLAGLGLDALLHPLGSRAARLAATGVCLIGTLLVLDTLYAYSVTNDWFEGVPIVRALIFPAVLAPLAIASIWMPSRKWAAVIVACIAVLEPMYWQSAKVRALMNHTELFPIISLDTARHRPTMWDGTHRDSLRWPNSALYSLRGQMNGYDPLQLTGYASLVAREPLDPFWRGVIEVGRWSNRPYLLMKRTFWLHEQFVNGEIPPRPLLFPVATTTYISNPPGLNVREIPEASVDTRPHSENFARSPLIDAPVVLKSDGTLDGPTAKLRLQGDVPAFSASLHVRCTTDAEAILEVRLPEKTARGTPEMVSMINLPAISSPTTIDIPLPDGDLAQIDITAVFPQGAGTMTIDRAEVHFDRLDEDAHIGRIRRTANTIEVEVNDLPGYRILSFIDFAYPGWHAYVDGNEAHLLKTFTYFKGVEVPPGSHRVRFVYRPTLAYAGIVISISALFVVILVLIFTRVRPRPDVGSAHLT